MIAWKEGWAEFYNAACHNYWYNSELPSFIEVNSRDYESPYPKVYQFMDYSQSVLFTNRDNTSVEGAVACFFYNLWDGVSRRAPNYTGDNDDVNYSGAFIINNLVNRYNTLGQLIGSTQIEAYKNAIINALDSQNDASVNALYNGLILRSGTQKPASPTSLSVSGNNSSRNISWNDNTCPSTISYTEEGYSSATTFDLFENQETGFRIYRKATSAAWNGTLDGYTLAGTVSQNTTTFTDNAFLTGRQSYVVAAYNSTGTSLPKAEYAITLPTPFSATISGPSFRTSGQSGTWTVSVSGGSSPYHYQWYYQYPDELELMKVTPLNKPPKGVWLTLGTDSPQLTRSDNEDFKLKCVVTDALNASVTSNIFYISVGTAKILAENSLMQNHPNPFNPSTSIQYSLKETGRVSLKVYDIIGNEVITLVDEIKPAGSYTASFDGGNLSSGVYFYSIITSDFRAIRKMLLVK